MRITIEGAKGPTRAVLTTLITKALAAELIQVNHDRDSENDVHWHGMTSFNTHQALSNLRFEHRRQALEIRIEEPVE